MPYPLPSAGCTHLLQLLMLATPTYFGYKAVGLSERGREGECVCDLTHMFWHSLEDKGWRMSKLEPPNLHLHYQ